jgi:hypothetical protein
MTKMDEIQPELFSSISASSINERKTTILPKEQRCRLFVPHGQGHASSGAKIVSITDY